MPQRVLGEGEKTGCRYTNDFIDFLYESVCENDEREKNLSPSLYQEASIEDFKGLEAIYMDHSVVLDSIYDTSIFGPLSGNHEFGSEKILRLFDSVLALNKGGQDISLKYPDDISYEILKDRGIYEEFKALKSFAEPFEERSDEKTERFVEMIQDASIARRAEISDEKSIIVTTDSDFVHLEDYFDINVYPPDVAELGVTTQI